MLSAYLLDAFRRDGEPLNVLCLTDSRPEILYEMDDQPDGGITWHELDPYDIFALEALMKNFKTIIHTASFQYFDSGSTNDYFASNAELTSLLVNAAIETNVTHLVYLSSTQLLRNKSRTTVIDETAEFEYNSGDDLTRSLYLAEQEVWRAWAEGVPVTIINAGIPIDPFRNDWSASVLHRIIRKQPGFTAKGRNAFIDVRDLVAVTRLLATPEHRNERYLVFGENLSFDELCTMIREKEGIEGVLPWGKWRRRIWSLGRYFKPFTNAGNQLFSVSEMQLMKDTKRFSNEKLTSVLDYRMRTIGDSLAELTDHLRNS